MLKAKYIKAYRILPSLKIRGDLGHEDLGWDEIGYLALSEPVDINAVRTIASHGHKFHDQAFRSADFQNLLEKFEFQELLSIMDDIDATDNWGRTLLHYLVINNDKESLMSIKKLITMGSNVNTIDHYGLTPLLQIIALRSPFEEPSIRSLKVSRLLLDSGANPDYFSNNCCILAAQQTNNGTALHVAAAHIKLTEFTRLLLDKGADVNIRNRFGETPLHEAVQNFNEAAIPLLLAAGADINAEDDKGKTPLMKLDESNYSEYKYLGPAIREKLIAAGAVMTTPQQ
ncbi:MAG: ankyrin repeat domain-containing protein [Cyanobacteria bacterium P01_F01_bin.150]